MVKKKRGRPKKSEQQLQPTVLSSIDAPITSMKFNKDEVMEWGDRQIRTMIDDRQEWREKRRLYIGEFDNLIREYKSSREAIWEGMADFHVPLTMWMVKQTHARLMQAMIGDGYGFKSDPQEGMDLKTVERVDQLMQYAIRSYLNNWKGIYLTMHDWVWDIVKEGWGVMKRGWNINQEKVVLTEEDLDRLNSSRTPEDILTTASQIIETFNGPTVETIDHEAILFPGKMKDSMDLNEPHMVPVLIEMTESDIRKRVELGLWDRDCAERIIKGGSTKGGSTNEEYDDAQRVKHAAQGTRAPIDSQTQEPIFHIYECYAKYDVDNDGFDENFVYWYSLQSREIPRWTTIDRVSPKSLKRPLYKADFIRRPRRSYAIGLAELLYTSNKETDAMHNQRIDFGTISSIPFFFYKPSAGMKKEKLTIEPGMGIPLQDPQRDINFPRWGGNVMFTRQEEAQLISYAERLAALPPMTAGQVSSPAGATMHATGFAGLLSQVGIDFDIPLNNIKEAYSMYLKHLHNDLQVRMPNGMKFRVMGSGGQYLLDDQNMIRENTTDRLLIQKDFDFKLVATSKALNRAVDAQDALATFQSLLNPILIQSGIVQPQNIYEAADDLLRKRGLLDVERLITKPQDTDRPLSLLNEIVMITQGEVPKVVMNDDHQSKIEGLTNHKNSEAFLVNLQKGIVASNSDELFDQTIKKHQDMLQAIQAQAPAQNQSGLQVSPTLGARLSGEINQQTGRSLASEAINNASQQVDQPFSTPVVEE